MSDETALEKQHSQGAENLKLLYDADADLSILEGRKIAIIGCGSQGHAHALNLKDSGLDVVVGLREGSKTRPKAEEAGLTVMETSKAAEVADIIMMLCPDTGQKKIYEESIAPHMKEGKALAFAHGFNIIYDLISPPEGVDVFMIAPKGPGHLVRSTFTQGWGVPALKAVERDATGQAHKIALAYAKGIGSTRAGVIETTFKEETETDLFGEQVVLCGGLVRLIQAGYETLVEAGYKPEVAYFECLHEVKLITDLIHVGGISAMNYSISDTAEWGEYVSGDRIITPETKLEMKKILQEIQNGEFAKKWVEENENDRPNFNRYRDEIVNHPIEQIGESLRKMMRIAERLQGGGSKQFLAEESSQSEYKGD